MDYNSSVFADPRSPEREGSNAIDIRILGQRGGVPVVCVGGVWHGPGSWHGVIGKLRDRLPVAVPAGCVATLAGMAARSRLEHDVIRLEQVCAQVAPQGPVNLLGLSWGSVVAACFAARAGERVRRLLLGSFAFQLSARVRQWVGSGANPRLIRYSLAELLRVRDRHASSDMQVNRADAQVERIVEGPAEIEHEIGAWSAASSAESETDLGAVRAQTLVVVGGRDGIISMENSIYSTTRIPGASLTLVPEVGHLLHVEHRGLLSLYRRFFLNGETVWGNRLVRGPRLLKS